MYSLLTRLQSLPFSRVQHRIATIDAQPGNPQLGSIVVMITGQLLVCFLLSLQPQLTF